MADLLITNGLVIDGTGAPARNADVAIANGRIEAIGTLGSVAAVRRIDATGAVVCPGFVDVHTHSELTLLSNPLAHSKIRQGVTTEVVGNCGLGITPIPDSADIAAIRSAVGYLDLDPSIELSWQDLDGYFAAVANARPSLHVASLVGHLPLRGGVVGFADRPASAAELDRMCGLLDDALAAGAAGFSTGLMYAPLYYANEAELVALGRTVARRDRIFAWHLADYADELLSAVAQAIRVGELAGCRTQISHLTVIGRRNWGAVARALELVDAARARGVDVGVDAYPYLAGNAPLSQLLPAWAQAGGDAAMRTRLTDDAVRSRVREHWQNNPNGWQEITINNVSGVDTEALVGNTVASLAEEQRCDGAEVVLDLLVSYGNAVTMVAGGRCRADLVTVLSHPATVIGSDGQALDPDGPTGIGMPHPRSYGCYPRLLADFTGANQLSLVDAIAKCTGRAARRMGLTGRGELVPNAPADVLVFAPDQIADRATYQQPQRFPAGIQTVIVAGELVVDSGAHLGTRAGTVLRVGE